MRMVHQRRRGTSGISKITRRRFVQLAGASAAAVAASSLLATPVRAAGSPTSSPKRMGVLTDITRCIGCRSCEVACNKANELPPPETPFSDTGVFDEERRTTVGAHTVVNRYPGSNGAGPVYRKVQCMHCNEPACVSVCPVAAMVKTPEGPTIWDGKLCMGCRYCMIACPFNIPTYEYDNVFRGIQVQELTPELRGRLNIPERMRGVVVTNIEEPRGLMLGDVIMEIERTPVGTVSQFNDAVSPIKPGQDVLVLLYRQGGVMFMTLSGD